MAKGTGSKKRNVGRVAGKKSSAVPTLADAMLSDAMKPPTDGDKPSRRKRVDSSNGNGAGLPDAPGEPPSAKRDRPQELFDKTLPGPVHKRLVDLAADLADANYEFAEAGKKCKEIGGRLAEVCKANKIEHQYRVGDKIIIVTVREEKWVARVKAASEED